MTRLILRGAAVVLLFGAAAAQAKDDQLRQIPDEYQTTSGHGEAMNNGGAAATDGFSAVRANPALIAATKAYTVNAGYHWPVGGRSYYQVGFVDSKTASWAMGVSYTGYTDDYVTIKDDKSASAIDSPIIRRGQLAVAQPFGQMLVGVGATYVEAHSLIGSDAYLKGHPTVKGAGLNAGLAMAFSPQISAGASVENGSNQNIREYAPRTYRAGVAYLFDPSVTAQVDLRQRDRVAEFEADPVDLDNPQKVSALMNSPERLVIGSVTAQVQDYLRFIGSYAQSTTDDRRALAGGVAIVQKNFSFSYTSSRPYMKHTTAHQAVTLSLEMAM